MSTFSDVETYRPVCILSFLSTAETDVLVPVLSQSTDGVVVSFVVVLKFPNVTIRTTKTVESVQLNGVVVSFVVVLKFPITTTTAWSTTTRSELHCTAQARLVNFVVLVSSTTPNKAESRRPAIHNLRQV